jgi:hypothetical protein
MKKLATTILATALCVSMAGLAVSAGAMTGTWSDSDGVYKSNNDGGGNNFSYYQLGESDNVTLTATITIGGEHGFMFGVKDVNGDGKIEEGADQYYLIDVSGTNVGCERNDCTWGGWKAYASTGKNEGDTVALKATYNKGSVVVSVDDKVVLEYGDASPFEGTGFGLCAKDTSEIKNVTIDTKTAVNNAIGTGSVQEGDLYSDWTVSGTTYTFNRTDNGYGNDKFATYILGNTDKKVTLSADVTINTANNWGGDVGFFFGVADKNNDGQVTESGDYYYIVDISKWGDHIVGIEKNQGRWGDWAVTKDYNNETFAAGTVVTLLATYDPSAGTIVVSVNGEEYLSYTDVNPLAGTGYGLISKAYGVEFKNVTVTVDTSSSTPETDGTEQQPGTEAPKTGSSLVILSTLSMITLAGATIAYKKRSF